MYKVFFISIFISIQFFGFSSENKVIDSLESVVQKNPHDTVKVLTHSELCWEYRFIDQKLAIKNGLIGVTLARKISYSFGEGKSLNDLSIIYIDMGKLDSAILLLNQAREIRSNLNDELGVAAIHNKLGIIYEHKVELEKALYEHISALKIYEKLDVKPNVGFCLNNIGNVHFKLGNLEKALEIHQQALEIRTELNDDYGIAGSHGNMGNVYMRMQDSTQAIFHFKIAVDMYRKRGNLTEMAVSLTNLGSIYLQQGNLKLAEPLLVEALEVREKINDARGISTSKNLLGELYTKTGRLNLAEPYLRDALKRSIESGFKQAEKEAYKNFALYFKVTKNVDSSYHYHNLYISMIEEEYTNNLSDKVTELQTIYETEKKDKENEILARLNAEEEAKRKSVELKLAQRNNIIFIISIVVIVILFFIFLQFQKNKRLAKEEREKALQEEREKGIKAIFETQEKERTRIAKDLHDGIGQKLSGIKLAWNQISTDIGKAEPEKFNHLIELTNVLDETASEVRDLSHQMMPKVLTEFGLVPALEDMISKALKHSHIKYEFDAFGLDDLRFSEQIELSLYRIAQELINNSIKHSQAEKISLQIIKNKKHLLLIVEDDGIGFDTASFYSGHGIYNIKSRIESINGTFDFQSEINKGSLFQVKIEL